MSTQPSQAKIDANRANAQHSTGPRTAEGKARVSRNATKHGLNSAQIFVPEGEEEIFEEFSNGLRDQIRPVGTLEDDLFDQLLHAAWNLRRIRILEAEMLASSDIDPLLDDAAEQKTNRLARHQSRYERSYHRVLATLRNQQTNRALAGLFQDLTGEEPESELADNDFLIKQTQQEARDRARQPRPPAPEPEDDDDFDEMTEEETEEFEQLLARLNERVFKK
jgi:hypothetical protein